MLKSRHLLRLCSPRHILQAILTCLLPLLLSCLIGLSSKLLPLCCSLLCVFA